MMHRLFLPMVCLSIMAILFTFFSYQIKVEEPQRLFKNIKATEAKLQEKHKHLLLVKEKLLSLYGEEAHIPAKMSVHWLAKIEEVDALVQYCRKQYCAKTKEEMLQPGKEALRYLREWLNNIEEAYAKTHQVVEYTEALIAHSAIPAEEEMA